VNAIRKEYREAADAVRCADVVTPEMEARYDAAKAAYDAHRVPIVQAETVAQPEGAGWWNLPIARSCWEGDARDTDA
jgi:hypothetical protein